jgi:competence protein ComEC
MKLAQNPPLRLRPLFAAVALVVLGGIVEPHVPIPALGLAFASGALVLVSVALVLRRGGWGVGLLLGALLCLGMLRTREARTPHPDDPMYRIGQRATLVGTVEEAPERGARGSVHFTLRTETGRLWCRLRSGPGPALGERVEVRGNVEAPPRATNPGQFDWKAHLERQGVRSLLLAREWRSLQPPGPLARLLGTVRGSIQTATAQYLNPEDAALLDGLLLSVRTNLPPDLDDALQRTGTVHVLSVSGLHLAALGVFLSALLTQVFPARRGLQAFLTLATVWIFALAVGSSPAALRSAVMLSVVRIAPLLKRDAEPLHSLAFAALVVLLENPLALFDPGTQLSFVACAGLLAWLPLLETWLFPWEPELGYRASAVRWLFASLAASVVAHIATWPLVARHFHVFSVIAPVANVPLAALSELLLLAGLLAIACGLLPVFGPLWWGLIGWGLRILRWLALSLAAPAWSAFNLVAPPLWLILTYYALFFGAARYVRPLLRRRLFAPQPVEPAFGLPPGSFGVARDVS